MSYSLFLDDYRLPWTTTHVQIPVLFDWVIVKSYDEFVKTITEKGLPTYVTFDHDLSFDHYPVAEEGGTISKTEIPYDSYTEKTGYHCAQWLINYCLDNNLKLPKWAVHSMNPVGKQNIAQLLRRFEETR